MAEDKEGSEDGAKRILNRAEKVFGDIGKGINDAFQKFVGQTGGLMISLDEQASNIVRTLGQSRQYAEGIRTSFADAVPEIAQISKNSKDFADTLQMAADAQDQIATALKTNILLTDQQMVAIAQVQRAYGVTKEELGTFVERFITAGYSLNQFPSSLEKAANNARAVGVNVDAVMTNISEGLDDINRYGFERGVDGLGKMAARVAAMRVDMKGVFNFADKVFDPENAIGVVAGLQRMGAAVGDLADPFRLMYLASEDVEELQKQIGNAVDKFSFFDEKSKSFKMTPNAKRDLRELENLMGIAYDDLVKYSQQSERLRIVNKDIKIGGIDEDSKQFIANVMQYSESKKGFVVKLLGGDEKLVSQINPDDLKSLEQANRELSPKEIARAQLTALESIDADMNALLASVQAPIAGGRIVSSVAEVMRGLASSARATVLEARPPRQTREEFNKTTQGAVSSIDDLISGKTSISELFSSIKNINIDIDKTLKGLLDGIKNIPSRPEFKQEIMSDNQVKDLGSTIGTALDNSISGLFSSFGIESKGGALNQTITQQNNVKVEDIKVIVDGEVTVNGKNNESVNVTPELRTLIENTVKSQLDAMYGKGTMNAVPASVR